MFSSTAIAPTVGAWIIRRLPRSIFRFFAEPDQFVAQMLDDIGANKTVKIKPRAAMKKISATGMMQIRRNRQAPGSQMTLWDMAMTVRDFAKGKTGDLRPPADRLAGRSLRI